MGKSKLPNLMQAMPDITETLDLLMLPCGTSRAGLIEKMPEIGEGQASSSTYEAPASVATQPESMPKRDESQACMSTYNPAQSAAIRAQPMPQENFSRQACMSQSGTSIAAAISTAACEAASRGDMGCLSQMIQNGCTYAWMPAAYHTAAQAGQVEVLRFLADALPSMRICLTEVS